MTFILFFFQFISGFSLQICYDDYFAMFYNLVFTAIPPLITSIWDKDMPDWVLFRSPVIYRHNVSGVELGVKKIIGWTLLALFHSGVVFGGLYFYFKNGEMNEDSSIGSLDMYSTFLGNISISLIMFMCGWNHRYWTFLTHLCLWVSYFVLHIGIMSFISLVKPLSQGYYLSFFAVFPSPFFWMTFCTVCIACLCVPLLWAYLRREFFPNIRDKYLAKYAPSWKFVTDKPEFFTDNIFSED